MKNEREELGTGKGKPRDIRERTFEFSLGIMRFCRDTISRSGWGAHIEREVGRQLLRSGTSVGANIEEAQAGRSRADFTNGYTIALKEARETIYWLRLVGAARTASDGSAFETAHRELMNEATEVAKVIGAIIVSTKSRGAR